MTFQKIPTAWGIHDAPHAELNRVGAGARVLVYSHHEIYADEDGSMMQTRSGPNWQGDRLTLATCKHHMRSIYGDRIANLWIAGVTPKRVYGEPRLMYLAKVKHAWMSPYDFYLRARQEGFYDAKSALNDDRGDVYTPTAKLVGQEKYKPQFYADPRPSHTRMELDKQGNPKWWKDITYLRISQKTRAPIFEMDPRETMFWRKPNLAYLSFVSRNFHYYDNTSFFVGRWMEVQNGS